jgi:hypothetical protein
LDRKARAKGNRLFSQEIAVYLVGLRHVSQETVSFTCHMDGVHHTKPAHLSLAARERRENEATQHLIFCGSGIAFSSGARRLELGTPFADVSDVGALMY